MKAVIIDDEFWTRDSIMRLANWEQFGIVRIEEAEDGLSGLRIINEIHPEIVITDMKMRGMDGVELLQKLTDDYPFIRKIVISGFDDFAYTKQAILSKVDEYLLKPILPDELNRAIERAVRELRISRGLHAAQPLDKEIMKIITMHKNYFSRHFQELQAEVVQDQFKALEQALETHSSLKPGLNHLLYTQFMMLLDEQASKAGIDLSPVISAHAATFYVTDHTPFKEWIEVLSTSYTAVIEEAIRQKRNRNRIDMDGIRQFIDHYYAEPITLELIAGRFFVSKEHLSRTFKQATGSTVMEYIITKRVDAARQLLQHSSVSIKSAAEAVGYSDLTYFHRIFKKITGMTPAQVRQEP
ncbi:response regulator transcription factor [Paenibacillus gansuensis]|uniref:Helix-turn-helix domain-containing protein n=1 Tax=Paenibacillus gansuensis TaxID=306542 RepID=A0ABW5P7T8_9BACL